MRCHLNIIGLLEARAANRSVVARETRSLKTRECCRIAKCNNQTVSSVVKQRKKKKKNSKEEDRERGSITCECVSVRVSARLCVRACVRVCARAK